MNINYKKLAICMAIPLAIGGLSGLFIQDSIPIYQSLIRPPFSPPAVLFPIVWTFLYILMGISSYIIASSDSPDKDSALFLYGLQLVANFFWPIVFFNWQNRLMALFILLLLWILVFQMIQEFHATSPLATLLQIPYLVWLTFAVYLNLGAYLLNR